MRYCEFCKLNVRFSDCANRKRAGAKDHVPKIEAKLKVLDYQKRDKKYQWRTRKERNRRCQ